jgi:hypothetical protein
MRWSATRAHNVIHTSLRAQVGGERSGGCEPVRPERTRVAPSWQCAGTAVTAAGTRQEGGAGLFPPPLRLFSFFESSMASVRLERLLPPLSVLVWRAHVGRGNFNLAMGSTGRGQQAGGANRDETRTARIRLCFASTPLPFLPPSMTGIMQWLSSEALADLRSGVDCRAPPPPHRRTPDCGHAAPPFTHPLCSSSNDTTPPLPFSGSPQEEPHCGCNVATGWSAVFAVAA